MNGTRLKSAVFLLLFSPLFSFGQLCNLDTAKYNSVVNDLFKIDYNCDYSLYAVQYSEVLKREKLSRYVKKGYEYKSLSIDSSQYTIVLFKLKKCKRKVTLEKSGYLGTPNPLYGAFFTENGYLILIYTYLPFLQKSQDNEISTLKQLTLCTTMYMR